MEIAASHLAFFVFGFIAGIAYMAIERCRCQKGKDQHAKEEKKDAAEAEVAAPAAVPPPRGQAEEAEVGSKIDYYA